MDQRPTKDDAMPWTVESDAEVPSLFRVEPNDGYTGVRFQSKLFDKINRRLGSLVLASSSPLNPRAQRLRELQDAHIDGIRNLAADAIAFPSEDETDYLIRFGRLAGRFDEQVHDLNSPDYVTLLPDENDPTDLRLGENARELSPDQQALIVDVYRAKTVVNIVFDRRKNQSANHGKSSSVKSLYLKELRDIALVAAESKVGTEHARKRLEAFQESFVAREAEVVKNQHLRLLGLHCLAFGAALSTATFLIAYFTQASTPLNPWHPLLVVLVMAAASCVGTWLSFSLRKVSITFGDLAGLEEDRLDPIGRVLFVMLLTVLGGLVLMSGLFEVKVADTSLNFTDIEGTEPTQQWIMAVLFGAFAGISERTLSGLVTKKADDMFTLPAKSRI